ncbi:MAG TPA: hypothetical protein VFF70_05025 [Anaerolineae bacterium]|nr:hypothetical protein [Anaerolineae bacterium]
MTIPLDSLVGELNLTGGARQSVTPATGVFTAPRRSARGRDTDTLYVLIDLEGKAPAMLIDEMKQHLARVYWSTPGSVTAALRAAVSSASEWLMTRNVEAASADRLFGGISCAVLRHAEVFSAQAGLANLYVAHQGSIEQFSSRDADPLVAIGMTRSTDVRFAHAELQPGDVVLLTDARSPKYLPLASISSAIVSVGVEAALRNLEKLTGSGDLIALVVETVPARDAAAARQEPTSEAASPFSVRATAQKTVAATDSVYSSSRSDAKVQSTRPVDDSTQSYEPRPNPIGRITQTIGHGFNRSLAALATLMQRSLPGPAVSNRSKSKPGFEVSPKIMASIAIGIPIMVAVLVATIYIQGKTQSELQALVVGAQNEMTLAAQANGSEARPHWAAALDQAQRAVHLVGADKTANELLTQAQTQLDKLDNIVRLTPIVLYNFKSSGPLRLALHNFSIFVLDRSSNELERVTLNTNADGIEGGKPAIVYTSETATDGKKPGNFIDMVWVNATTAQLNSSLMILHRDGLLQYDLTFGFKSLTLGIDAVPSGARRLRSFDGNLYLLDPPAKQVWRYRAKDSAYAAAPETYFDQANADAANAVDMAIDGNVYLISADGRVIKYSQGITNSFKVDGLADPMSTPSIIAVDSEATNSSVYIVDQASQRIVQLRPDGQFVRQFRANGNEFNSINDLAIDERSSRLYVISAGVLYSVPLPPISSP